MEVERLKKDKNRMIHAIVRLEAKIKIADRYGEMGELINGDYLKGFCESFLLSYKKEE